MGRATAYAMCAILINAIICAIWAARVDTYILAHAVLTAALVMAMMKDDEKRQR